MVSQRPQVKGLEGQRRVGTPRGERHRVIESMSFVEGFGERNCVNESGGGIASQECVERLLQEGVRRGWPQEPEAIWGLAGAHGLIKRVAWREMK